MIKFLPILLIIIIVGAFIFVKIRPQPQIQPISLPEKLASTESSSIEERIKNLESAVTALLKQAGSTNIKTPSSNSSSLESKVTTLESNIANLQTRVNALEKSSTTTTQSSSQTSFNKSPIFITLGSGSSSSSDWTSISGTAVTFNSSDYSGYTGMQLQTSLNVFQTGTAYARLYNKDDGTSPSGSEVSTTSTSDTILTSATFTLPSGSKTYVLQVKSQVSGYATTATNAKIKINF